MHHILKVLASITVSKALYCDRVYQHPTYSSSKIRAFGTYKIDTCVVPTSLTVAF